MISNHFLCKKKGILQARFPTIYKGLAARGSVFSSINIGSLMDNLAPQTDSWTTQTDSWTTLDSLRFHNVQNYILDVPDRKLGFQWWGRINGLVITDPYKWGMPSWTSRDFWTQVPKLPFCMIRIGCHSSLKTAPVVKTSPCNMLCSSKSQGWTCVFQTSTEWLVVHFVLQWFVGNFFGLEYLEDTRPPSKNPKKNRVLSETLQKKLIFLKEQFL